MTVQPHPTDALVFMAKWPEAGRAKTRLSPPLPPTHAAALARAFLLDTLAGAAVAGADRWVAFAPAEAEQHFRDLLGPDIGLIPAEAANLGIALAHAQQQAFLAGYRRVALVSSDIPHLPPHRYAEAFAALDNADVVVGGSDDGGYYLLATSRPSPSLFEQITWSTDVVFAQTLNRAAAAHLRTALLPACADIDTAADLPALHRALLRAPGNGRTLGLLQTPVMLAMLAAIEQPVLAPLLR